MKKLYSKKLGGEAYALDAAQLKLFAESGYATPTPEEVIKDAAVRIEPPEGKRAYVVFDFKTGVFSVRARTATLTSREVGEFIGEVVQAALLCRFLEQADPDKPKAPAEEVKLSPIAVMIKNALTAAAGKRAETPAEKAAETTEADSGEVVE